MQILALALSPGGGQADHLPQRPWGCERDDMPDELAFSELMAGDVTVERPSPTVRLIVSRAGSIRLVRRWLGPPRS